MKNIISVIIAIVIITIGGIYFTKKRKKRRMELKDQLIQIENELDQELDRLSIWSLPFQTIISMLFLAIENIALSGRKDTAMDYTSRLSYIYKAIKNKAGKAPISSPTEAILKGSDQKYMDDINFLNAYAHFSMLMPQIRRDVLKVNDIKEDNISITYFDKKTIYAETIDRLYSYLALQMSLSYRDEGEIEEWVDRKAKENSHSMEGGDFHLINKIYNHYNTYYHFIKPLPDDIFEKMTGITYKEYHSLSAVIKAFSDYFIKLGRAYKKAVNPGNTSELNDELMSEYFEWSVCTLNFKTLGWFSGMTGISLAKLDNYLSFYMQIYSNTTGQAFLEKSFYGEGYFPPFILFEDAVIFSPHACIAMTSVNNILYSLNKLQKKFFDEEISKHLEPALICQLEYIFSFIPGIKLVKNINYEGGEMDLMALSENENTAICMQVKSTIAPDSSRTVERVNDRVLEGIEQINHFDKFDKIAKQDIINGAFGKELSKTKIINIIVVRSCAGTSEAWENNKKNKIINYPLLAWLLSNKIEKGSTSITAFDEEIEYAQNNLIDIGATKEVFDKLKIGKYTITFPNLNSEFQNVISMNLKALKFMKDFEDIKCK